MPSFRALLLVILLTAVKAPAQTSGVQGDWREPGGSVLRIAPCGTDLCATIIKLRPDAPKLNIHDPDPAKRTEPLCGLRIGYGFHPLTADKAAGGQLYDPKTGKTYHGEMHTAGDTLYLRGYIGIAAFGRTETWQRVPPLANTCPAG